MKYKYMKSLVMLLVVGALAACSADRIQYNQDVYNAKSYTTDLAKYATLPTCTSVLVTKCKTVELLTQVQVAAAEYEKTQAAYTAAIDADSDVEAAKIANDAALKKLQALVSDNAIITAIQ